MYRRVWSIIILVVFLGLIQSLATQAQIPAPVVGSMPGFSPFMPYENFGQGENVNLANLNLLVEHPSAISLPQNLGQTLKVVRYYNSKAAEIAYTSSRAGDGELPYGVLGMGWTLSLGRVHLRLFSVPDSPTQRVRFFYSDESGAEHRLYLGSSHQDLPYAKPASGWYYTNDSSYIRAQYVHDSSNEANDRWYLYFPDGSIRVAGGAQGSAYLPPNIVAGTDSVFHLKNKATNGWYVTKIVDKCKNAIDITYDTCDAGTSDSPPTKPMAGAILTIEDQFLPRRTIRFGYDSVSHLLATITTDGFQGGTRTEGYAYQSVPFPQEGVSYPVLTSVTDPQNIAIQYGYNSTDPGSNDTYLKSITYPTGAVSRYVFQAPSDFLSPFGDVVKSHTLSFQPLDPSGALATTNRLEWIFDDSAGSKKWLGDGRDWTTAVQVRDPLGRVTIHFLTDEYSAVSPGKELAVFTLVPTKPFTTSTSNDMSYCIHRIDKWYSHGDSSTGQGDSTKCLDDATLQPIIQGNPRVRMTTEAEYDGAPTSPVALWSKTSTGMAWNGYGDYGYTQVTAAGIRRQVAIKSFQLQTDIPPDSPLTEPLDVTYLLGSPSLIYAGSSDRPAPDTAGDIFSRFSYDLQLSDPLLSGSFEDAGEFTATRFTYDSIYHQPGVVTAYKTVQSLVSFNFSIQQITSSPTAASPGDVTLTYTYSTGGNLWQVDYAGGDGGHNYRQNLYWDHGVMQSLAWALTAPYPESNYSEFTRSIDTNTSWIASQTDANGKTTEFSYDPDGRILRITPPDNEAIERVSYPDVHTIHYYKGTRSTIPDLAIGQSAAGSLDVTDIYAVYSFDDLGRQWRTDSVAPNGSWTERVTLFDPLGRAFFSSRSYPYIGGTQPVMDLADMNVAGYGGAFELAAPRSASGPVLGAWDSIYDRATSSNPFSGTVEPHYRTQTVVGPDGSHVDSSYSGLVSTVTLNEINAQPGLGGGLTSMTQYTKDELGRTVSVTPPASATSQGTRADYTYSGLGKLFKVRLNSGAQTRQFEYDALGHLISATLPEMNGSISYDAYDPLGHLLQYTDASGKVFTKAYDSRGRAITAKAGSSASDPRATVLAQWYYDEQTGHGDALGRLTRAASNILADGSGGIETSFIYDQMGGRLGSQTTSFKLGGALPSATYQALFTYDTMGSPVSESLTRDGGFQYDISSTYQHGALYSKKFADGHGVTGTTYYPSGGVNQIAFNNGTSTSFVEESVTGRLAQINWTGADYSWSSGEYAYDGAGAIRGIGSDAFRRDESLRLTHGEVTPKNGGAKESFDYTYDLYGNISTRTVSPPSSGLPSLQAKPDPATNRLASYSLNGKESITPIYDNNAIKGNGNMTFDGVNDLSYDALNRLVTAGTRGTTPNQYYYDPDGERAVVVAGSPTYFFRVGGQVCVQETLGTPKNHVKASLYVGGHLATSEEGDIDSTPAYSVSGRVIFNGSPLNGVVVATGSATYTTGSDGNAGTYILTGLYSGDHTITAKLSGYSIPSQVITISDASETNVNFIAARAYSISGTITSGGTGLDNVSINTTGASATTAGGGHYTLADLPPGTYTLTMSKTGYTFPSPQVTIYSSNVTGQDFTAIANTHSISGSVLVGTGGPGLPDATVTAGSASTTTIAGAFTLSGFPNGTYTVTPALSDWTMSPATQQAQVNNADYVLAAPFSAAPNGAVLLTSGVGITATTVKATMTYYYVIVPSGTTQLVVTLKGLTANANLYARSWIKPTLSQYDFSSTNSGTTSETITVTSPAPGVWFFGVYPGSLIQGRFTIKAAITTPVCTAPSITVQPQGQSIVSGQSATLSVTASGTTPLSYQWYEGAAPGGTVLGGEVSATYTTPALSASTSYWVQVTNACGTVNSGTAAVSVGPCLAPSITAQPQSQTIPSGLTATLSVTAGGSAPLSYQWYEGTNPGGTAIGGATTATYITPPLTANKSYWVKITNPCGTVNSGTATIAVICMAPTISGQPQSQSIARGGTASLSVTASGSVPFTYQWYQGTSPAGTAISGATFAFYTTPSLTAPTSYWVKVTNTCGTANSDTATITPAPCLYPRIVTQPQSQTIASGQTATLTVSAMGSGPLLYQWHEGVYPSGAAISGATSDTYTTPPLTTTKSYWVGITGACSGVDSTTATITVMSTTQLFANQGFESGDNGSWINNVVSGTAHNIIVTKTTWTSPWIAPHGGIYQAQLCGANGTFYNSQQDALKQQITIPSTALSATLTFWVAIATKESSTAAPNDTLAVQVLNTSGTILGTLKTLSNQNGGTTASWGQQTADLTSYKGQTLWIKFLGTTNGTLGTVFLIDDTAVTCQVASAAGMGDTSEVSGQVGTSAGESLSAGQYHVARHPGAGPGGPMARGDEEDRSSNQWTGGGSYASDAQQPETAGLPSPNTLIYYYVWDQVGSVRVIASSTGAKVETHDYEPYGLEIPGGASGVSSLIRYAGHERDYMNTADTTNTMDYMHFRSYEAVLGRFMKPDNIMGSLANPQSWNLYSYVQGDPIGYGDPSGHFGTPGPSGACQMWYGNSVSAMLWNGMSSEDYLNAVSAAGRGTGATLTNMVYAALNPLGLGDLTAAVLKGEATVHIEAVMDETLTWEQQNAYREKFDAQVADAAQVFGWLGIGFSVTYAVGDVTPENSFADHTVRVLLSGDFAALHGDPGGVGVLGNKALVLIAESKASSTILSHELGHVFGIRGPDILPRFIEDAVADTYINNLTRNLRYTGPFALAPFAPGWSLGPWVEVNALHY